MRPTIQSLSPSPKAAAKRAIENGNATGSATQKDGISQRPIERDFKAGEMGRGTWVMAFFNMCVGSDQCAAAKGEEGEEEGCRGKGNRQTKDDLDQTPEAARCVAKGQ